MHERTPPRSRIGLRSDAAGRSSADTGEPIAAVQADQNGHSFSDVAVTEPLAAGMAISQPADPHEQEAERLVADAMARPGPPQAASQGDGGGSGAGRPLDQGTLEFMNPRFGFDFSAVRIHDDERAATAARSVHAKAYTVGTHVVFGRHEYAPDSAGGRDLLGHELAHVVQNVDMAAPPRISRFVGPEHEKIGNAVGADVDLGNGVVLTWGEVVAIAGDEFGTVEELQEAAGTDEGRRRIRAALLHAEVKGPMPAALNPSSSADPDEQAKNAAAESAHGKNYLTLLLTNVTHFAAGGSARDTWRSHHARALAAALDSGLTADMSKWKNAQLLEAFGQHYLTDMFSGGHVRTPRQEMMDYYREKAPAMAEAFLTNLRTRLEAGLVSQIMLQIDPALRNKLVEEKVREKVHAKVESLLKEKIDAAGGRPKLIETFGLALAGAVSGAMHDREGRKGVKVKSEAHPEPWLAKGDGELDKSPESEAQSKLAVTAAVKQVEEAHIIGESEMPVDPRVPITPPAVVHFAFDSVALGAGAQAAAMAGVYLSTHPGVAVEVVGHTDPIGRDAYNADLGTRRAEAVRDAAIAAGARPEQVVASTAGETNLVTSDPKRYADNRRVEFHWQPDTAPASGEPPPDPARDRAQAKVAAFGPPYRDVERYIPEATEDNEPLPEWRWGSMEPEFIADVDRWMNEHVGAKAASMTGDIEDPMWIETGSNMPGIPGQVAVRPRPLIESILNHIFASPARRLGELMGQPPGR
jgi:outer membrane protein OmpA-like peptidoglycan-associated protein